MIAVVTPDEMEKIDRASPESVDVLIGRAGSAVAAKAVRLLGGTYGRRVVVIAGKGNNGNDGREAARRLRTRGVRVNELDPLALPDVLPDCDLVIDAAFGTGFRGEYHAPDVRAGTPVLAIDIPSGVDGLTGQVNGSVMRAAHTVTFAALKPGLVFHPGAELAGTVEVVDIGLDVSRARTHVVEAVDVVSWLPKRAADAHKWQSPVWVIGGSPGLEGAAVLACRAAVRAGAGYVRWSTLGDEPSVLKPIEVVTTGLPEFGWSVAALDGAARFGALVIGNGIGLDEGLADEIGTVVAGSPVPVVVDADAITLLGPSAVDVTKSSTILTPHDGEFARLYGRKPGPDRIADARELSVHLGAIVVLKGSTTVVAAPDGRVLLSTLGDQRLATLGTGDVLAGVIGALCAQGVPPFEAAGAGAFIHGAAGALGWHRGMVAGDLIDHIPAVLDHLL